jgi:predicted DCC family thiol-disulfide oxidoreductase YuxK
MCGATWPCCSRPRDAVTATPILVFDGDCGFCTTCARWIEHHVRVPAAVIPWQWLDLDDFGLTPADAAEAVWWIDAGGRRHRGHRALGHALLACGRGWRLIGRLCLTPPFSFGAGSIYRCVVRYRDRLPGATPACRIDDRRVDDRP